MNGIRLLFGRPIIRDKGEFVSALRKLQGKTGCTIQAIDADNIVSERHLTFAAEKALSAFSEGRNIAKDLGVEILRYASGERQIERALAIGLSDFTERIGLIIVPGQGKLMPEDSELSSVIEIDRKGCIYKAEAVKKVFNISEEELWAAGEARISDLVLERVALVDTYR
ncbi:MAG: KEOPS complex subunit Cgi121 [Methanotrichaceae archaeon]